MEKHHRAELFKDAYCWERLYKPTAMYNCVLILLVFIQCVLIACIFALLAIQAALVAMGCRSVGLSVSMSVRHI